jgi:cold shock CspA family protein
MNNDLWKIGHVKFFVKDRGFGFVNCWDDQQDYFIHITKVYKGPIIDHDFVVFKLAPSRKKTGKMEAIKLSLVSKFDKSPEFLKEQFIKYDNVALHKEILKALSIEETLEIVEKQITRFENISNEEQYSEFKKKSNQLLSLFQQNKLKERIEKIIDTWAQQITDEKYRVKLWLDNIISESPEFNEIETFFSEANDQIRIEIFTRLKEKEEKQKLLMKLIQFEQIEKVVDFILQYLRKKNSLGYYEDLKSELFDVEYWKDKTESDLLTETYNHIEKTFDQRKILSLSFSESLMFFNLLLKENCLTENDASKEYLNWLYKLANKVLDKNAFNEFDNECINQLSESLHFFIWEKGQSRILPLKYLSDFLLQHENNCFQTKDWVTRNLLEKEKAIELLKNSIKELGPIQNRQQFYILYNHLKVLSDFEIDVLNLINSTNKNFWFFKLALWVSGLTDEFEFDEFKIRFVYLSPEHQIKFLKKIFWLQHTGKFSLTIEKLNQLTRIDFDIYKINQKFHSDILLDISVDVVIEAIKSFKAHRKFLFDRDLLKIVLKDLSLNQKHKFQIYGLFEKCRGRYEAIFNWKTNGEVLETENGWVIAFEYNRRLVEEVRRIPGSWYVPEIPSWIVPIDQKEAVLNFAKQFRFFIRKRDGNDYINNIHLAEWKRTSIPNGIQFCEGRLAKINDSLFNKQFWWCRNKPCFKNCEADHTNENYKPDEETGNNDSYLKISDKKNIWEDYTMLDFLKILSEDISNPQVKDEYYEFVATINRFNRLLERMYCEKCENILYPIRQSNFAHYRVVRFHCENSECPEYHKEIYLHHCLNGNCNGIIDSRKSKKCPNGLYICTNNNCGCCCSNEMLKRRLQNLQETGGFIHDNLKIAVEEELGHLERAEYFCYKCGELMEEISKEQFRCNGCNIKYDLRRNKFKRPL